MYVIFTSGSTGRPKGVMLEHAAVATSIKGHGNAMGFCSSTRALQFAAYNFDASIAEIFTTLTHGGCVCIPSDEERLSDLVGVINRMSVNWAFFTPSVIALISPEDIPTLKILVLGGEAVTKENVKIWGSKLRLMNGYGPTETCVFCVTRVIEPGTKAQTIGQAVSSISWVTHPQDSNKLTPVGCIGELLVEGASLARGYLNDNEKTSSSFVDNLGWTSDKTRRFYKTGDLVRYNSNGTLDYLGRKDGQVKIRGQRLELSEVEHCLWAEDEIDKAIVVLPKTGCCAEKLVTVLTLRGFSTESVNEGLELIDALQNGEPIPLLHQIRDRVSDQLPTYMVPTIWLVLKSIPLTTSGKLDRALIAQWLTSLDSADYEKCLNIMDSDNGSLGVPATVMDSHLQKLLAPILNISEDRVNFSRSFVKLGGDSITAMQVVSRARSQGIIVTVQQVLQSKSISQLSILSKFSDAALVSRTDDLDTPFDLSPMQQFYFQLSQQKPNRFNQSFFLRITKRFQATEVLRAVETIIRQHSMLRARYIQDSNGRWTQVISSHFESCLRFNSHDSQDHEFLEQTMMSTQAALDIERGPLFAVDLFDAGEDQLLYLVAHHLVIDLVSWRTVLHDLEEALQNGSLKSLAPFPFQAWTKLQAEHASQYLAPTEVLPFTVLPTNWSFWGLENKTNVYGDTSTLSFSIDPATTSLLLNGCQEAFGTEPVEVFMATLLHSFGQVFKNRIMPTLFTEGHGREPWTSEIDISDTVGWFTTMSPLQINAQGNNSLVDVLRKTKDTRRRLPGNGWPYFTSRFLNEKGKEAFSDHMPIEVLFNYLGQYQQLERTNSLFRQEGSIKVPDVDLTVPRLALFEISVGVVQGSTQFSMNYNRHLDQESNVSQWMQTWEESIIEATTTLPKLPSQPTLSDFPLLPLTYDNLDRMSEELLPRAGLDDFSAIEDIYPCSPMQQGLVLSQLREAGNYEVSFIYEVKPSGKKVIDVDVLLAAWQEVVNRHPILRTIFIDSVCDESLSDQLVLRNFKTKASQIFCSGDDDLSIATTLEAQPLLDHSLLVPRHQLTLCKAASGRVFVRIEVNHTIIDAASISIVLGDWVEAYEGRLGKTAAPLYSNYIKYLQKKSFQNSMKYWAEYLDNATPSYFPTSKDSSMELTKTLKTLNKALKLRPEVLRAFCSKYNVTVANIVQATWALVLAQYTGTNDVCYGYLSSGRDVPVEGIEGIVGPLINMIVCRTRFESNEQPAQMIQQVKLDYLSGLEHQHFSLAQIQHKLGLSSQPLFNTILSIQQTSAPADKATPGLTFAPFRSHDPTEVCTVPTFRL